MYRCEDRIDGEICEFDTIDDCKSYFGIYNGNYTNFLIFEVSDEYVTELDQSVLYDELENQLSFRGFEDTVFQYHTRLTSKFCELHRNNADEESIEEAKNDLITYEEFFKKFFDLDINKFYKS